MKTEEILRYESEFKAMQEVLGTFLLVFEFPKVDPFIEGDHTQVCQGLEVERDQVVIGLESRNST